VLLKNCDVRGVFWGAWADREREAHRANVAQLMQWCADGKLAVHVHAIYPLAQTTDALKAIANRQVIGKVIVRP
jgi:NADPH:quinone reductase